MRIPTPQLRVLLKVSTLTFLLSVAASLFAEPPSPPTNLRVNDVTNPVGTSDSISFGWLVTDPDSNEIQSKYQILVASDEASLARDRGDLWDSGPVTSRRQSHVYYAGAPLTSDTHAHWKVRTWDKDGNASPYSETQSFTVGFLENADWDGAKWIRRDTDVADSYTYFRRKISLDEKPIARATAYISGTHKYSLFINSKEAGDGPAYHYPEFQYYNAFDVTSLLNAESENQLAIFNHWFGGGQGRPASKSGVILKLIVHYEDGSIQEVNTDGSWLHSEVEGWATGQPHRNRGEGVGYVERIDARKLQPDWYSINYDDSDWEHATVVGPHPSEPWTGTLSPDLTRIVTFPIKPASIEANGEDRFLVDLGKVYSGMPEVQFSGGSEGDVVSLLGGYALDESGEIDVSQNQVTDLSYYAILNSEDFTFEPVEYLGYRYLQIDNAPMPITEENFSFIVRHSELDDKASSFESSNDTLNAVWELMKHSIYTCAQEEFVDTPTREKGGFLGDAAIQSAVAMPVLHDRALTQRVFGEYLQSMKQHWAAPENRGRINAVYPNNDGARDIPDYNQAFLPWAWDYYMETGDIDFLDTNYARLLDVADYNSRHIDTGSGLVVNLTGGAGAYRYGIIDWPASMRFGYDMETAARTVINCWAYLDFLTMAQIADVLGKVDDRDTYSEKAKSIAAAINQHLRNDSGLYVDGLHADGSPSSNASQHSNMFPLALGIVPEENRESVFAHVKQKQMSVGMITVRWLIRSVGEMEDADHLIELFTNAEWNGWANCLSKGATATWESWFADTGRGESQSHAWGAIGLEGYIHYILGIRPLEPQYESLEIRPLDFGDSLEWAKGHITTDRGPISVSWIQSGKSFQLEIELPTNVTANVSVPAGDTDNTTLTLNGEPVPATRDGNYLTLQGTGSGKHTIERN